jgi:hypothetical protein
MKEATERTGEITRNSILRMDKGKKIRIVPAKRKISKKVYTTKSRRVQANIRKYCLDVDERKDLEQQITENENKLNKQNNKKEKEKKRRR